MIEAGPEDTLDAIHVPAMFCTLFGSGIDWNYQLEEQTHYRVSAIFDSVACRLVELG